MNVPFLTTMNFKFKNSKRHEKFQKETIENSKNNFF